MDVRSFFAAGFFLFFVLLSQVTGQIDEQKQLAHPIIYVKLHGSIDVSAVALVTRGLRTAHADKATALILELDTPGGEVEKMWDIARPLKEEKTFPTICFVNDKAISAGAIIAIACEKVYLAPSASIGAALPVTLGPTGLMPAAEDPAVKGKIISAFRSDFRALAEYRGKNPRIAEAMVDPDMELQRVEVAGEIKILTRQEVDTLMQQGQHITIMSTITKPDEPLSLTAQQALQYDFINGIADSQEQLLEILAYDKNAVKEVGLSWSENLVGYLSSIAPILFLLGCVFAWIEIKMPGFGVAGILSLLSFALVFFGNYLSGLADITDILLFGLGIGLIAVEFFLLPGSIVFGLLGVACILYGIFFSFLGFTWPETELDYEVLQKTAAMFGVSLLWVLGIGVVISFVLDKYLPYIPFLGKRLVMPVSGNFRGAAASLIPPGQEQSLLGKTGLAVTDLRPAGKIRIENRVMDAQSHGSFIEKGSEIKVIDSTTNRIVVARNKTS